MPYQIGVARIRRVEQRVKGTKMALTVPTKGLAVLTKGIRMYEYILVLRVSRVLVHTYLSQLFWVQFANYGLYR